VPGSGQEWKIPSSRPYSEYKPDVSELAIESLEMWIKSFKSLAKMANGLDQKER